MTDTPTVLFVCIHNAGRSQMAAGYLTSLSKGAVEVRSGGSEPGSEINPVAIQAMAEEGIDISGGVPQLMTTEQVQSSDVVITMGCGDVCPIFPGTRYEDWDLADPAGKDLDAVRPIRDEIKRRVEVLLEEIFSAQDNRPAEEDRLASLPVAVIGAGPVGLAAAAHLLENGLDVVVYEAGPSVATAVRAWGHTRLFSPWEYVVDPAASRILDRHGWEAPAAKKLPTGASLVEEYLVPLAESPELRGRIRYGAKVVAVTREGMDRTRSQGRSTTPFLIRVDTDGVVQDQLARAVIDTSGTFSTPNALTSSGVAPAHVADVSDLLSPALPDVLGVDRERFVGKRVVVVGAGHSAANTLLALAALAREEPATTIAWAIRGRRPARVYGAGADELEGRGALGDSVHDLVRSGSVELIDGFEIDDVLRTRSGRAALVGRRGGEPRSVEADVVVTATGFRPDIDFLREIRISLDEIVEAPRQLAPLIDPNLHSCGTVPPHGVVELAHPEPNFFIAGMKSYGRAPTFLLLTGYEQVRSIAAELAGDHAAARLVQLSLPETGACSTGSSTGSCCS